MQPCAAMFAFSLAGASVVAAQTPSQTPSTNQPAPPTQVNWLYGAYVPKDVPLVPLTGEQRRELWLRQTALTPGIYAKTAFFALGDHIADHPPEWHGGFAGFSQRFASRYGQFAIQTTMTSVANWALQYEPRYDRCRCAGAWPRIRHALLRNFVTYDRSERHLRPQIGMYAGAWGAGLVASTWKPAANDIWQEGLESIITQVAFGSMANLVGEFALEIGKLIRREPDHARDRSPDKPRPPDAVRR